MDIYELLKTSKAYASFLQDVKSERTMHSYIVHGRDKFTVEVLTRLFACLILCNSSEKPCLNCSVCKRIIKGTHPDCRIYSQNGEKILVGDIDDLTDNVSLKPCEGDRKVFIINSGETMNEAGQNKLLKTLEEPNESAYIIIGATNTESLLPTVLSRCREVCLELFSKEIIYDYLVSLGSEHDKAKIISKLCAGMLGKAQKTAQNEDYLLMFNYIYDLLGRLKSYNEIADSMTYFSSYPDKSEIFDIMQIYFRDCLVKISGQPELSYNGDSIKKICYDAQSLIFFIEKITEAKRKLSLNCNFAPIIETLLVDMVQKRLCV